MFIIRHAAAVRPSYVSRSKYNRMHAQYPRYPFLRLDLEFPPEFEGCLFSDGTQRRVLLLTSTYYGTSTYRLFSVGNLK